VKDTCRARWLCIASVLWSAILIPIELAVDAPGYALAQGGLLLAGAALLRYQTRVIAASQASLPPPAPRATAPTAER
jgi:hypothetical protein